MSAPPEYREPEKYPLDRPHVVKRIYQGLIAVCAVLGLLDVADLLFHVYHKHGHYDAEYFPNFYGFYGLAGCIFLVLAAKQLRKVVMRNEDYYDNDVG